MTRGWGFTFDFLPMSSESTAEQALISLEAGESQSRILIAYSPRLGQLLVRIKDKDGHAREISSDAHVIIQGKKKVVFVFFWFFFLVTGNYTE